MYFSPEGFVNLPKFSNKEPIITSLKFYLNVHRENDDKRVISLINRDYLPISTKLIMASSCIHWKAKKLTLLYFHVANEKLAEGTTSWNLKEVL